MIKAVDQWAVEAGRTDVIAQVGSSSYSPRAITAHESLRPDEFSRVQKQAELLVAHCGIGSMLSALECGQPVLMMPRRHALGEHRNDHQLATAERLSGLPGVHIAWDETELIALLGRSEELTAGQPISDKAPPDFVANLALALRKLH